MLQGALTSWCHRTLVWRGGGAQLREGISSDTLTHMSDFVVGRPSPHHIQVVVVHIVGQAHGWMCSSVPTTQ